MVETRRAQQPKKPRLVLSSPPPSRAQTGLARRAQTRRHPRSHRPHRQSPHQLATRPNPETHRMTDTRYSSAGAVWHGRVMTVEDVGDACFICEKHRAGDAAEGGVLYQDDLVYAGHVHALAGPTAYRGQLVVEPKRHAPGLGDLTDE